MSRARIVDGVIAAGVAAALLSAGLSTGHQPGALDPLGYAALVAGGLALAARRRAPVVVLGATAGCALVYQAAGFEVPVVAYLFAVYAAVRAGHRVAAVVASVIMLAAVPLTLLASGLPDASQAFTRSRDVLQLAWLIAAGAAGEALRQAERRADEAERTREETARRRADEERLHIARELHDSLTHQISVIKVQAEVAVHLAHKRGEDVPKSLLAIRDAGREAARELRATLEALRDDEKNPPRGLDDVPELVRQARTAGLDARLTVEGDGTGVPAAVGRTAYRIVQEALTNVARTPPRPPRRSGSTTGPARSSSASTTTAGPLWTPRRRRVSACSGCANASPRSADASRPLPAPRAASASRPNCPWTTRHDPRPAGRRPAAHPQRLPGPPGRRGRRRGGRRSRRRPRSRGTGPGTPAGHRAPRRPDAGRGRPRSDLPHRRRPGAGRRARRHPDQLRPGRIRLRSPARRRGRVLVKDIRPEDFLHAVRVAARGDALLAPSITRKLIDRYVTQPPVPGAGLAELTNREREAVALVARGLSNDEIAARMVISPLTAKTHVNRAMAKLRARDRAQLVVFAYESGLVPPGPQAGRPAPA